MDAGMSGELDRLDAMVARLDLALARAMASPGDPVAAWELSACIDLLDDHRLRSDLSPELCSLVEEALQLARSLDLGKDRRPIGWWTNRPTAAERQAAERARSKLLDIAATMSVMRRW